MFQPGDKVLATSAVFGNEIWPAAEYGRTMYTVRQRIGPLLMKMQKKYGEREDQAVSSGKLAAQRNANVISEQLREIQLKKQREEDLRDGLQLYKKSAYQEALSKFESVLGSKPEGLEEAIASYNVACCYAKLDQVEAGLSALGEALEAGFEDYKKIRTDEDLASLRASPEFKALIDKYDEPIFNENAVKAIKGLFGFFGKT
ncbi:protein MET1, chloroplastic [Selaginella moellendorffii]|uniref:protein MET1, chloroplastic n=1 Tax=Selaginella moellendorffii TaxID=88036 RepID=UPI000D1C72D9|nr:protein MET1, chloroplastic [Selaginella moellendorffii]|eukprot:XP_024523264.1 protein MET1, chloroplastic [Selaginella moellendorffii]